MTTATATKTRFSLGELMVTDFPEPGWTVPGILPVGLGSLSGRPKQGKSIMGLQVALAKGTGGTFFGYVLQRGPVLYIALEDSPRRLKERLVKMGAPLTGDLAIETTWRTLAGNNSPGLRDLAAYVQADRPQLIVIDTLTRACGGRVDWNDVGQTTAILAPLQEMAQREQLCVLLVDHHRKQGAAGRDVIDDILGSSGKSAVLDCAWGLYRKRGERGATLAISGRDVEEQELAIELDATRLRWRLLGNARQVASDTVQAAILEAVADLGGSATITALASYLNKDKGNVAREVMELVFKKKLRAGAKMGRTRPYELVDQEDPFAVASI